MPVTRVDVSATRIRAALSAGEDVASLLPAGVLEVAVTVRFWVWLVLPDVIPEQRLEKKRAAALLSNAETMSSMRAGGFSSFHSTVPVSSRVASAASSWARTHASSSAVRAFGSGR